MALLETPSRIWRRIEDVEGKDMPSLPSLPAYDDSAEEHSSSLADAGYLDNCSVPVHSTPATMSSQTATFTMRPTSSTASTVRFANSVASRSTKSAMSIPRGASVGDSLSDDFDASAIPSLPDIHYDESGHPSEDMELEESKESVPEVYLPPEEDDHPNEYGERGLSMTEALQSISRGGSPIPHGEPEYALTPYKNYDYSVSLRSEPKPSPFNKFRNVSFRKPLARTRTPSLSRTTPSPESSSANSTPQSGRSLALSPVFMVRGPNENNVVEELVTNDEHELSFHPGQEHHEHSPEDGNSVSEPSPGQSDEVKYNPRGETEGQSHDDREPTFSSEEGPAYPQEQNSPQSLLNTFSSPAPSAAFTPTPAFPPRPKARFDVQTPLQTPIQFQSDDEPVTPHTRRRSFLLSVINSTTRPRLKFPTPHPRGNDYNDHTTTTDEQSTPGSNLRSAFAGVTPRPRTRTKLSHLLAQANVASPATSVSPTASGSGSEEVGAFPQWSASPSDGDRASFISTASSHDLTTHHRANTSFDPVMGLGAQGHGVGRFNAGKLNAYLHGLNRRLQEENEGLVERLRKVDQEKNTTTAGRRLSVASRRVSLAGTALGDVEEDVNGEGWVEEKAGLEKMVEAFKEEVQRCIMEREAVENAFEEEKRERVRDKERWRERMTEVERGVEDIIKELERKIQDTEKHAKDIEEDKVGLVKDLQRKIAEVEREREIATERVKKSEQLLANGRELGGELKEANERVGKVMADLRNANVQIRQLEEEVMGSDGRVDKLEQELAVEKQCTRSLEDELQAKSDELATVQDDLKGMVDDLKHAEEETRATKDYVEELEEDAGAAVERIESLERQLANANSRIEELAALTEQGKERSDKLAVEIKRNAKLAKQMEEALEAAEEKMSADEGEIAELKGKLLTLQYQKEQEYPALQSNPASSHPMEAEVEALEDELEKANREIGRLNTMLNQSPARKAIEKAKDARIELLEAEKEELMERVQALRMAMTGASTPNKLINDSNISHIHRQALSVSIRAPRTPGGPLRDMSWLNNTSDPTVAPLVAEISRLQRELDRANESIDDKLDKLGEAGLGVVGLTKKLEDARSRIVTLEEDIARLSRREDRRLHRLERARCQKCLGKVDLRGLDRGAEGDESSLELSEGLILSDPPTPPTKTSEALRANLQAVNAQLDSLKKLWVEEKHQLLGENAVLQDTANRLNAEVLDAKEQVKRFTEKERTGIQKKAGLQEELDKAKEVIVELETELKSERVRLRSLTAEQNRVQQDKRDVLLQLQRTESDMEDIKGQLHRIKQENRDLEQELRVNAIADQRARLLEVKVAENNETIEQLRQERSMLTTDHKELHCRFSEISDQANRLRDEYAASQTSHDNRRHQLDLYLVEIEDLRRALSDQAIELQRTEAEKKRIAAEKSDVTGTVAALEADLRRVRKDAEAFGRDLKLLRIEKEKLEAKQKEDLSNIERARKQSQAQIRLLNEQLESEQEKTARAKSDLKNHVCVIDEQQLSAIKLQHNKECKGLMAQIQYLKAKFTRESSFRCSLGYQKQYLLILLSSVEKSEQTVVAAIARLGFPTPLPAPAKRPRSLKCIVLSVVFTLRAKHASDLWREQSASKEAIAAALQEVRRRRVTSS